MRGLLICASWLMFFASGAGAEPYRVGSLEILHPWSRATPKGSTVAAGYLQIHNKGSEPDRLIGGSSAVSKRVEIHATSMEGGVAKMRSLKEGVEIKPGNMVELKPGASHLMFLDLSRPLQKGERVKGTLVFEKAGTIDVEYVVEAPGGRASGGHAH